MADVRCALDKMLEASGKTREDFVPRSLVGKALRRQGVARTAELDRILALPRRRWQDDPDLETVRRQITEWLALPPRQCPESCVCRGAGFMELRPVQAKFLEEAHDFGGLLCPIAVGQGKTICSFLAPVVLGAARPLLFVPAKLRDKTLREFALLRRHWIGHPGLSVMSYEELSSFKGEAKLEAFNPDVVICDEAHRYRHREVGCTRKFARWIGKHEGVRCIFMSGTITTRSVRDYDHLARWACKRLSPLPRHSNEAGEWGDATDAKIPEDRRLAPGALLALCSDAELDEVAHNLDNATPIVRRAYMRRLTETPSVVATDEDKLGVSLSITGLTNIVHGPDVQAAFRKLRTDWVTPDDHPFSEASELWRHARELSNDFYYVWSPRPPAPWLAARKAWSSFVRDILGRRMKGLDTELQVAKAVVAGRLESSEYWQWGEVRDTFVPNSVPVWIGDAMLKRAAAWLAEGPGVCWTEHVAFGKRLMELTGRPYFGAGGLCNGTPIEEASGPVIASIQSCGEGRNLQRWDRALVVSAPPNGRILEQMLGRLHRQGQDSDEVSFEFAFACREQWEGFAQSVRDCEYVAQTTGQPQKVLYADKDLPSLEWVASQMQSNPLWNK